MTLNFTPILLIATALSLRGKIIFFFLHSNLLQLLITCDENLVKVMLKTMRGKVIVRYSLIEYKNKLSLLVLLEVTALTL